MGTDNRRRKLLGYGTTLIAGIGAGLVAVPFLQSMSPVRSKKEYMADNSIDIDISGIEPGQIRTVSWIKPVFIVHRTDEQLINLESVESYLVDPDSNFSEQPTFAKNRYRSLVPEYLLVKNECTHLGCSLNYQPTYVAEYHDKDYWKGGFDCPCHTSYFDLAGRAYKQMPASENLMVPPYVFLSGTMIRIGVLPEGDDS